MISMNGYLMCTPYKNEGLKTTVNRGMLDVRHTTSMVGLKLLKDYKDKDLTIKAGSIIYFKEKDLSALHWAKEIITIDEVSYILARLENAVAVSG